MFRFALVLEMTIVERHPRLANEPAPARVTARSGVSNVIVRPVPACETAGMRITFAFLLIAVAGCGDSSRDPASLEIAWQQPLARADVCPGSGRCAFAWSYGDPPQLEIAPFTAAGYELT